MRKTNLKKYPHVTSSVSSRLDSRNISRVKTLVRPAPRSSSELLRRHRELHAAIHARVSGASRSAAGKRRLRAPSCSPAPACREPTRSDSLRLSATLCDSASGCSLRRFNPPPAATTAPCTHAVAPCRACSPDFRATFQKKPLNTPKSRLGMRGREGEREREPHQTIQVLKAF